jgi:hypothetical protein
MPLLPLCAFMACYRVNVTFLPLILYTKLPIEVVLQNIYTINAMQDANYVGVLLFGVIFTHYISLESFLCFISQIIRFILWTVAFMIVIIPVCYKF